MTRWYTHASFYVAGLITIALLLSGCVAPSPQVAVPTPQVIMQGDTPGREEVQPIELDNCNGKADLKRTEQRSRSIESTVSAEIAARLGTSAEVISAEVQVAVGAAMKWGTERSTAIELVAPPGTRMAFQLVWIGDEQLGIVQNLRASGIPIAFRSFKPTDVRIKSQYDIGCPESGGQPPLPTSVPQSTPVVVATSQPSSSSSIAQVENLGLWEWGRTRPPMPEPAMPGQVVFAHGDIDNSGSCHVTEFGPGQSVQGLGSGTFRLLRITGTPEQIKAAEAESQQGAANGAGGSCPWK